MRQGAPAQPGMPQPSGAKAEGCGPGARSPTVAPSGPSGWRKSRYPSEGDIVKVDYEDDGGWMFGRVDAIDVARNAVEVDFEDGEMVWVEVREGRRAWGSEATGFLPRFF